MQSVTDFMYRFPKRQISKPVQLQQGKVYFMQAIVKEGGGGDHLSVKVKLPSGVEKAPLGGKDVYTGVPRKCRIYVFVCRPFTPNLFKFKGPDLTCLSQGISHTLCSIDMLHREILSLNYKTAFKTNGNKPCKSILIPYWGYNEIRTCARICFPLQ